MANQAYRYTLDWLEPAPMLHDVRCNTVINTLPEVLGGMRSVASLCETGFAVVSPRLRPPHHRRRRAADDAQPPSPSESGSARASRRSRSGPTKRATRTPSTT